MLPWRLRQSTPTRRVRSALEELVAARPAFGGTTEAQRLATIADSYLGKGTISWLEIGAGDGRNLRFLLAELAAGRRFKVTALEPAGVETDLADVAWLQSRVEDYQPDTVFDWMNLRHSAYYIVDPISEIARLSSALKFDGAIALTHWSRDCVLSRLHAAICGPPSDQATAGIEDVVFSLGKIPGLAIGTVECVETALHGDLIDRDAAVAEALYELARRRKPSILPSDAQRNRAATIRTLLRALHNPMKRLNGVAIIRRVR